MTLQDLFWPEPGRSSAPRQTGREGKMEKEIRNSEGAGPTGPIDVSNLPAETFEVFKKAIAVSGKKVPALARSAEATRGLLNDAG